MDDLATSFSSRKSDPRSPERIDDRRRSSRDYDAHPHMLEPTGHVVDKEAALGEINAVVYKCQDNVKDGPECPRLFASDNEVQKHLYPDHDEKKIASKS